MPPNICPSYTRVGFITITNGTSDSGSFVILRYVDKFSIFRSILSLDEKLPFTVDITLYLDQDFTVYKTETTVKLWW